MKTTKPFKNTTILGKFKKIEVLGEGSYGKVYKAKDLSTNQIVAVKKIKFDKDDEGIPSTTLREISILKQLNHENLVSLLDVEYSIEKQKLILVFEYIDSDFKKYIDKQLKFHDQFAFKKALRQIIRAVDCMHANGIFHRDMKPQNILFDTNTQTIKVCDFGLARAFQVPYSYYTTEVQTLWYRSPELMLGDDSYSVTVDMWSVGCIFAEMIDRKPLLQGESQIDMIFRTFQFFGTPNEQSWPGVTDLQYWKKNFPKFNQPIGLASVYPQLSPEGLDLLEKMLTMCPAKRITAREALNHRFFNDIRDF